MELRVTSENEHPGILKKAWRLRPRLATGSGTFPPDKGDTRGGRDPTPNLEMSKSQKVVPSKRYVLNFDDSTIDLGNIFLDGRRSIRRHRGFRH